MKEPKDKRTKAYKEWKAQQPSEGLGDVIEKITEATGIKTVVEKIFDLTGKDCGCDKRKETLNKLFPSRFKARCLTEDEYNAYSEFKDVRTLRLTSSQVTFVCELHASVFNKRLWKPTCLNCGGTAKTLIGMIDKLDKVHKTYKDEL